MKAHINLIQDMAQTKAYKYEVHFYIGPQGPTDPIIPILPQRYIQAQQPANPSPKALGPKGPKSAKAQAFLRAYAQHTSSVRLVYWAKGCTCSVQHTTPSVQTTYAQNP